MSTFYSPNNFAVKHQYRDFYSDIQRNLPRIGDEGKESDDFKKRSYDQFKDHNFHALAKVQDSFVAEDPTAGSRGREKNRNMNRMEYDIPEQQDRHSEIMEELDKTEIKIKDVLKGFDKQGYTVCSTAHASKSDPVEKKDYEDQIKF